MLLGQAKFLAQASTAVKGELLVRVFYVLVLVDSLAGPPQQPARGEQALHTHRAAGVNARGRYAHLCTNTPPVRVRAVHAQHKASQGLCVARAMHAQHKLGHDIQAAA